MYIQCVSYGQTLQHAKRVAKDSAYTILARNSARGIWDIYTISAVPIQSGQKEFIVAASDKILNMGIV